jgi:PPE-repeat protein
MSAVPAMLAMFYGALPPEVNTSRLMAGAGEAPMYQAAAGWETLALSLETQAEELSSSLASLTAAWSGTASEQAVSSTTPMVVWLRTTALQAQKRAMQAIAQANSYMLAMTTTPPIPEIEMNHVTHAVLEATNFCGINLAPIGINEEDYFIRMWDQAAMAMEGYQAETSANTIFEPIPPVGPIVVPGVGESGAAAAMGQIAALSMGSALRETAFAHVAAQATVESVGLQSGNLVSQVNDAAQRGESAAQQGQNAGQQAGQQADKPQQGAQMAMQLATQVGSQVAQLPQQLGQMISQPMQQFTQPLQQMTSMFSSMGSNNGAQMGLMGASPFSNHPLIGGSGASVGSGLIRAASLPGAGGSMSRTPLMSSLIAKTEVVEPEPVTVGAAAGGSAAGLAPVGSGGGAGSPMGMHGQNGKSGGSKPGLRAPTVLTQDLGEDEADDW